MSYGKSFFVAANGYGGFRDYFKEIFTPYLYTRIYVLKGGPGTGKSSLMKKIKATFESKGCECESVYCSSDIKSLDGVIINQNGKKFAILDGTSPHETDAKIPGAADEIINLGIAWDKEALINKRGTIEKINKQKANHYREGYEYLNVAGKISEVISKEIKRAYVGYDLQYINDILFDLKPNAENYEEKTRLISSFSKNGYQRQNTVRDYPKGISVYGSFGSEYIFTEHLLDEVRKRKVNHTRFPSPFSDSITEGIYLENSDTLITVGGNYENTLDTALFLDERHLNEKKEKLSFYTAGREELINRAEKEFALAAEAHFALEAIYTKAMDFQVIDKISKKIAAEIENN